jgi:hypothetical protein
MSFALQRRRAGRVRIASFCALGRAAVVDLGPDHYARLTAVSRLLQVLTAGRPVAKAGEPKRQHIDVGI